MGRGGAKAVRLKFKWHHLIPDVTVLIHATVISLLCLMSATYIIIIMSSSSHPVQLCPAASRCDPRHVQWVNFSYHICHYCSGIQVSQSVTTGNVDTCTHVPNLLILSNINLKTALQ